MPSKTFSVPNISCHHCVLTIERELGEVDGVTAVSAAADTKKVHVEWQDPASWEGISAVLVEIEYPPSE